MSHTRKDDQSVDAFSAPKDLLAKAKRRAVELKMTKSGFYRYCLAKALGYSEEEARLFSEHRAVLNSVASSLALADKPGITLPATTPKVSYHKVRLKKLRTPP